MLVAGEGSSGGLLMVKGPRNGSQGSFSLRFIRYLDWILGSPSLEAAIKAVNVLTAGIDEILGCSTAGMAMIAIDNWGF